jgi:hypothetical protein
MRSSNAGMEADGSVEPGCDDGCDDDGWDEDGSVEAGCAAAGWAAGDWAKTNVTEKEEAMRRTATFTLWACLRQNFNHPPPGVPAPHYMWDDGHALWLHGKY